MLLGLHQWTAAVYLAAALAAALGLGVPSRRAGRASVFLLAGAAALHLFAFLSLHRADPPPSLRELPIALSLGSWIAVCFFLVLLRRARGLVIFLAPAAFLATFTESLVLPGIGPRGPELSPLWSHLHIMLASAGFALAGVSAGAGVLYVLHHRALKAKKRPVASSALPSLEALDRANGSALALGFLLLTLAVASGMVWVYVTEGHLWPGGWHANTTIGTWFVYAGLVGLRHFAPPAGRRAALTSAVSFAALAFVVVGVGVMR